MVLNVATHGLVPSCSLASLSSTYEQPGRFRPHPLVATRRRHLHVLATAEEGKGGDETVVTSAPASGEVSSTSIPGGCSACGKPQILGGCDGKGRMQGGIGAVQGFGWWPIKAYRPCPAFVEAGGRYRRQGQSLDEVAFGRKGAKDDLDIMERLKG